MKALLLAAGQGRRLMPYTKDIPKALLSIDEKRKLTIIEYQVEVLKELGLEDIIVVVGYRGDKIRRVLKDKVVYIENKDYESTNSIYSVFLALSLLNEDVIIMNADVLFHKKILEFLFLSTKEAVITVDSSAVLDEETMKVVTNGEYIIEVRKDIDANKAFGENVGIVRFRDESLNIMKNCVRNLVGKGLVKEWFPRAFNEFIKIKPLYYIDIAGLPWIEIDFPKDLLVARRKIFPQIIK